MLLSSYIYEPKFSVEKTDRKTVHLCFREGRNPEETFSICVSRAEAELLRDTLIKALREDCQ